MKLPIVSVPELLQSARDAGYLSTAHAVAELVDNAVQAGATEVAVTVESADEGLQITVRDDGCGMDAATLATSLRLGGSTRYGDRGGLGRYGMGLPSSSLSQARRVDVWSRRDGEGACHVALDLDEVLRGCSEVEVTSVDLAELAPSGTVVRWSRCDRLVGVSARRVARELRAKLGRTFRRFIWAGLKLHVDGDPCPPIDPLYLDERAPLSGARLYCEPLIVPIATAMGAGDVTLRFSELPVERWQSWSVGEKRRAGVTASAAVSVMRAGREVDHAWLFMGDKKRESYDAWWRCEVEFPPSLDEVFGLTFSKQQVRPSAELVEALTPIVSPTAHALNRRARVAHNTIAARARCAGAERRASKVAERLPPLTGEADAADVALIERVGRLYPELSIVADGPNVRLVEDDLGGRPLIEVARAGQRVVVVMNRAHPYYVEAYAALAGSGEPGAAERRTQLELLLIALARAEVDAGADREQARALRARWSDVLAEHLRG